MTGKSCFGIYLCLCPPNQAEEHKKGHWNWLPSFTPVVSQRERAAKSVSEFNNSITNARNTHTPLLKPGLFRGEEFIDFKLLPLGPSPLIAGKKKKKGAPWQLHSGTPPRKCQPAHHRWSLSDFIPSVVPVNIKSLVFTTELICGPNVSLSKMGKTLFFLGWLIKRDRWLDGWSAPPVLGFFRSACMSPSDICHVVKPDSLTLCFEEFIVTAVSRHTYAEANVLFWPAPRWSLKLEVGTRLLWVSWQLPGPQCLDDWDSWHLQAQGQGGSSHSMCVCVRARVAVQASLVTLNYNYSQLQTCK